MKQYVNLDEKVTTTEQYGTNTILRRTVTIAEILEEHDAEYTPLYVWEIKEEKE